MPNTAQAAVPPPKRTPGQEKPKEIVSSCGWIVSNPITRRNAICETEWTTPFRDDLSRESVSLLNAGERMFSCLKDTLPDLSPTRLNNSQTSPAHGRGEERLRGRARVRRRAPREPAALRREAPAELVWPEHLRVVDEAAVVGLRVPEGALAARPRRRRRPAGRRACTTRRRSTPRGRRRSCACATRGSSPVPHPRSSAFPCISAFSCPFPPAGKLADHSTSRQ